MTAKPATLYFNARVYTMDREVPQVEAMLVRGERIQALGSNALLDREADAQARRVDLDGQTIVPGFNDCHCHILTFGLTLDQIDLSPHTVHTLGDLQRLVNESAQQAPDGEWVIGRGYDQNALVERRHPSRQDLDAVSGDHPMLLWHASGHALTCNSRALQLAGITANTVTSPGAEIQRDDHGEPTGVMMEDAAIDLVASHLPAPTLSQGRDAIIQAMQAMAGNGITSASDAATGTEPTIDATLRMYAGALDSGQLAGRITLMPQIQYVVPPGSDQVAGPEEFKTGNDPAWLRIGPTKIFADGALTTRTAALRQPYADDASTRGLLIWEPEELVDAMRRAHVAGWQIATHAIGDRAVATVLDCYQQVLAATPRDDHRHRIEHCMLLDRELAQRMRSLGVVATIQPGFIARFGDAYVDALGLERASSLNPMEIFDAFGIPVGFSSDRPVIPGAPLTGILSALDRTTPRGVVLGAQHALTALQAIRDYTVGSAYVTRAPAGMGTLRRGGLADFTVLSKDPSQTPLEQFDTVRVAMTVVGGRETFVAET